MRPPGMPTRAWRPMPSLPQVRCRRWSDSTKAGMAGPPGGHRGRYCAELEREARVSLSDLGHASTAIVFSGLPTISDNARFTMNVVRAA